MTPVIGPPQKMAVNNCLACEHKMDLAAHIGGNRTPDAGDITICIVCAHVMAFNDGLTFRELTAEEQKEVFDDVRVQRVVMAIKQVHRTAEH